MNKICLQTWGAKSTVMAIFSGAHELPLNTITSTYKAQGTKEKITPGTNRLQKKNSYKEQ